MQERDDVGPVSRALTASLSPMEARRRAGIGVALAIGIAAGVASLQVPAFAPAGGLLVAAALVLVVANVRAFKRARLAVWLSGARNEVVQGHLGRAEALLGRVDAADRGGVVARARAAIRGEIALARGDVALATEHFDAAIALPPRALDASDAAWLPMIRAERALARALAGETEGARADVDHVRALVAARAFGPRIVVTGSWIKRLLGRAALAEVICAHADLGAGRGERGRLQTILRASKRTVEGGVAPRERALFRALANMARARVASVYRRPATAARDAVEAPPSEWVERVLPGALPHVRHATRRVPSKPVGEAKAATQAASPIAAPTSAGFGALHRLALLWAVVVIVAFSYLSIESPRAGVEASWERAYIAAAIASGVVLLGLLLGARGSHPRLRAANEAMVLAATDPTGAALSELDAVDPLIVAVKDVALAQIASDRGDFAEALARSDAAVAAMERLGASPDLAELQGMAFTSRATALAALGLEIDARATVSRVPASFTGRAGSVTVVELLIALSGRKVAEARAIADEVSDVMPLDARAELLVDLLRATDPAGAGADEVERLREDLTDEGARAFVLATAPDVLRAFERGRAESSPAVVSEEEASMAAEAEAEAAESEAAEPRRVRARS